uniref:Uncharacterized protein n=1 Tax=Panagrolaimus sp. PS1159 TaxID=55785 RepID=A0AC35FYB4_9BILA
MPDRDVAESIGLARSSDGNRFQNFFSKTEDAGNIIEPEHALQILVDQLTREKEKLKKDVETLDYMVQQRDEIIANLEKDVQQPASHLLSGP